MDEILNDTGKKIILSLDHIRRDIDGDLINIAEYIIEEYTYIKQNFDDNQEMILLSRIISKCKKYLINISIAESNRVSDILKLSGIESEPIQIILLCLAAYILEEANKKALLEEDISRLINQAINQYEKSSVIINRITRINVIAAIPVFNEALTIAVQVLNCKKYVDRVIVVDDGSSDETAIIASALGAFVVCHKTNRGYDATLRTCFDTAKKLGTNVMVIIDGERGYDSKDIPKLVEPLLKDEADIVIGSRFLNAENTDVPAFRKIGKMVLDTAINVTGGINVSDSESTFRAYGKKAIEKIRIVDDKASANLDILFQVSENALRVKEVGISRKSNETCKSTKNDYKKPSLHLHNILDILMHDIEYRRPMYYFFIPGAVLFAIGIAMGLEFLSVFYHGGNLSFGAVFLILLYVIIGFIMIITGIILHAFSKMLKIELEKNQNDLFDSIRDRLKNDPEIFCKI